MDSIAKAYLTLFGLFIVAVAAWLTHVISCINHDKMTFLIAGGLVWPIGVIHGLGIWIGAW